jgi:drug/metabolite transporter (DMT)-like permease
LAGIFYGVNIAGTGAFTKKLNSALYIMVLLAIESVLALIVSLAFHFIKVDGVAMETIRFSFEPLLLLARIALVLLSSALCWVIRTNSMKHVDATVVAVMMPFSSIIAGVLSVLVGMDALSTNLVVGAVLGFIAMLVCAFGDIMADKKAKKSEIS